tara:strand:- start:3 stop:497 length:495 start_codon:yes stop_codon:yes gene_type:complete
MAISSTVKNMRDGTLAIEDGTGTPISLTVQYEEGNFSGDGFSEGQKDVTPYMDRGDLCSLRYTVQTFPTFSFDAYLTDLSDGTEKTLWDLVNGTGAFAAAVSTRGANAECLTYKLTWTVEGTDHGDSADHVLTLDDCRLSISIAEGDPNKQSISGICYGTIGGS